MPAMLNELVVMNDVVKILQPLTRDERRRVIDWLADYLDVYEDDFDFSNATFVEVTDDQSDEDMFEEDSSEGQYEVEEAAPETFEALFERVSPKTAIQKIVTSAYWLENNEGKDSWTSFQANKLLKSLDVKISSVSGTLAIESKKELPLIVVLEKSGDSMQSRKTFRLSDAGFNYVESRLA